MISIRDIDHIVLRVIDVDGMIDFYSRVLGCPIEMRQEDLGLVQLRAGRSLIDLVSIDGKLGRAGGAAPGAEGRNVDHFCLRVETFDEPALRAHLQAAGIRIGESGSRYGAEGDGPSLYILDPEGNTVELKGPPWANNRHAADRTLRDVTNAERWIVETDRLRLREIEIADLDFIATMLADAEVMRHYPSTYTRSEAQGWIERQRTRYTKHGHGLWLAILRETGQPVGQVGLLLQEVEGIFETEIGYLLHKPFWHQGLATEAALGVRQYAFASPARHRLITLIRPANTPSQAVARRVGMVFEREVTFMGRAHLVFSQTRRATSAADE